MKTVYSPSGRILSIEVRPGSNPQRGPIAHYQVEAYDPSGAPKQIKVTYFDSTKKPVRIDEFWLIGVRNAEGRTASNFFHRGDLVIDERIGRGQDEQVSYNWTGSLPTMEELQKMHAQQIKDRTVNPSAGGSLPLIPLAGIGLIVTGVGVWSRRRVKRSKAL
jgi:hypothetical protein